MCKRRYRLAQLPWDTFVAVHLLENFNKLFGENLPAVLLEDGYAASVSRGRVVHIAEGRRGYFRRMDISVR